MDKIESSPKYGLYMNKTCKILSLLFVSISALCLIAILIGLFATGDYQELTEDEIISLVIPLLILVFANVLVLVFYIRQHIFEKKLKLWEKDFVKLYTKVEAGYSDDKIIGGITVVAIFKFRYERQDHVIKGGPLYNRFGETKASKLIGQKVPIYYSPTYDEVVFIKETQK